MANPLATIFHGDLTLEEGYDVTQFGYGDLNVRRNVLINGTTESTNVTNAALVVKGGMSISKVSNLYSDLNVLYGVTRLTETHIDTSNGPTTITGGNKVDISVGAASQFVSTGGNLLLQSLNNVLELKGGLNSVSAIDITATHVDGGIKLLSGSSLGKISMVAGSGGIEGVTSNGNVSLTANNGAGSFYVNSVSGNQNLSLNLTGNTDSQLSIESAGNNETRTAMVIRTTNTSGNITISTANGLGAGALTQLVGSGGFRLTTNTGGPIDITAQAASSSFILNTNGPGQNMIIGTNNCSNHYVLLKSAGELRFQTTCSGGNIITTQTTGSGKVEFSTGSGGFIANTQNGGSINLTASGATSTYTNATNLDNQDLTVSITGDTNSKVIISSSGTGSQAIKLQATNVSSGIYMIGNGAVEIVSGTSIQVGSSITYPGIPVSIGTPTSTTTVNGNLVVSQNLTVQGTVSTVNSEVVNINDNIILVNSGPEGNSDGGMAIKRYQYANNLGNGDVVNDTPEETGTISGSLSSDVQIQLSGSASNTNDYYAGWWIKLTGGEGADQVRRIKSYNGTTKVATIYSTSEQTGILGNPEPVEGMDLSTRPDTTTTYALYPCQYVMSIWDESADEFALVCSSINPSQSSGSKQASFVHYADLHLNALTSNSITANIINGSNADITTTVTLNNNSLSPVTITIDPLIYPGRTINYGIFLVFVKPYSYNNRTRTHGIFMIGRLDAPIAGTVVRIISVKGAHGDQLDMLWPSEENPQLLYRPYPSGISGTTTYQLKFVSL